MLPVAYYYRGQHFLYPLRSQPEYWFHVGKSDTKQAIIGLLGKKIYVVLFNGEGDLVEVQELPLTERSSFFAGGSNNLDWLEELVGNEVSEYRKATSLVDQTIRVKRFRFPELQIGIEDLPDDLQGYLLNPESFSSAERADLEATLRTWKKESQFVFWWGQDFYVDSKGIVTSS